MKPIDRITVGLSLTDTDTHLLEYAAMLAGMGIGKSFQFAHVIETHRGLELKIDETEARERIKAAVLPHFASLGTQVNSTFHVCKGARIDGMLSCIDQHRPDKVLVGHQQLRHGRQSMAMRLAMICPTSVWMIPDQASCQISRILAPIDFSCHSAESLCRATDIARRAGLSECLSVHVNFNSSLVHYEETVVKERARREHAFEQFISPIELHDVNVIPHFADESNVTKAILRVADEQKCDLIVVSTRGRSPAASVLLGSVTSQILMESKIPVLAVKHRGAFLNLFQVLLDSETWSQNEQRAN